VKWNLVRGSSISLKRISGRAWGPGSGGLEVDNSAQTKGCCKNFYLPRHVDEKQQKEREQPSRREIASETEEKYRQKREKKPTRDRCQTNQRTESKKGFPLAKRPSLL